MRSYHSREISGEGIAIAILDSGFPGVDNSAPFEKIRNENRIKYCYDFVENEEDVYDDHSHGTKVLSTIAAFQEGELIGAAFGADFYLFVTEDVHSEFPVEEFFWLVAAESADSLGVDIITSSLGYSTFDNPKYDYSMKDLTGDRSIISLAADFAASTGILVVCSSGNSYDPWGLKLHSPADGDSVLAVGSVNANEDLSYFSARGPTADGRIKPDVVALGEQTVVANGFGYIGSTSGTSFSAPLVAGLAACVWQSFPHLNNMEVLELIRMAGNRYNEPDNGYGFGIPHYNSIMRAINSENHLNDPKRVSVFPNPARGQVNFKFTLSSTVNGKLELYNVMGQLVSVLSKGQMLKGTNHVTFDVSDLEAGMYLFRLQTGAGEPVSGRFIIK
ncbi:S8 family peptidase [Fulvivirga sp. 29W222]|uniref:S8 family peptidase n=1 Tax=Fulvivirga marina TaxID=2494733 RepID=A0A937KBZ7_9BACT|nr:S8/S53 family peptidase [Fulvivirga marina]MBL6447601.1 S8 family peptidase [Fulvivirga marina]